MKTIVIFAILAVGLLSAKAEPDLGRRGPAILKEIVSQPWAVSWKKASLKKVRLVSEKPDLEQPLNLSPVWVAEVESPTGANGHVIWDSTGAGKLVEFSFDDKLVVNSDSAKAMSGIPFLQQFVVAGKEEALMASGCVPTAAASVVSYWAKTKYPQWRGGDSKTRKDLALRLRGRLKMSLFPDQDGFTENGMTLAGAFPGDLLKVLRADAAKYQVPMEMEIGRFSFPPFKKEIDESRPVLLSCVVRVPHKPVLSWGHEVAAVGYCEIDGVKLVGVQDNFFPTKNEETIRWIREDAFRSMITLRPRVE